MPTLFYIAMGGTLFLFLFLVSYLWLARNERSTFRRVLDVTRNTSVASGFDAELRSSIAAFIRAFRLKLGLTEEVTLRDRLEQAGFRSSTAVDIYIAARVVLPILVFMVASTISWNRAFLMIALPALAYLLPDTTLRRLILRRRNRMRRSVPDAVDLLVICVDAGLGIDQALLRVGDELVISHPELNQELMQIHREQRAGRPRLEAWEAMSARTELAEIQAFVNMLTQSERFGTPISKALRDFADGVRQRRRQAAEEMAAKTPVKMIFPLVLTIFPSIFIVLVGPAAITIMRGLGAMNAK